jgi:hypothetical protein
MEYNMHFTRLLARAAIVALTLISAQQVQAQEFFLVDITAQDHFAFEDCWEFDDDGNLALASLTDVLGWDQLKLGKKKKTFQAVTILGNADYITLGFSGKKTAKKLMGNAINATDSMTFTLKGKSTDSCEDFVVGDGPNPYRFPSAPRDQ